MIMATMMYAILFWKQKHSSLSYNVIHQPFRVNDFKYDWWFRSNLKEEQLRPYHEYSMKEKH